MNKRRVAIILAICVAFAGFCITYAQPGSESDPVVTLSYIKDTVIPEIYEYIDSKIRGLSSGDSAAEEAKFEVAEVPAGKKVICDESCEIILRAGEAEVIATQKGGLADTTAGADLSNGTDMPKNHLLVVPVDDGRGAKTVTDCIFMIKGSYSVK